MTRRLTLEERLVWWVMAHADHKGTDVRLSAGQLMKPDRIPRQGIDSGWWRWKAQVTFPWRRQADHINEKELRAAFTEVRRKAKSRRSLGTRYLHLLDSAVALGVLTRHRSTSQRLQRVLRRQSAVELGSGVRPVYAFVRSSMNPADRPSRVRKHGTKNNCRR